MSQLFTAFKSKKIELCSRLVMPPMASATADDSGYVSKALCNYYDERTAPQRIGLVISEHSFVSPEGKYSNKQLSIADDACIAGLKNLTELVHSKGSKIIAQLAHAGAASDSNITGYEAVSPSGIRLSQRKSHNGKIRSASDEDIQKIIADFCSAAMRAKKAGFDGVQLHSAHGYLLNQFYSPISNKRSDAYTGINIEGRIRLHLEIIEALKKIIPENFILSLRLGACDYTDGGSSLNDAVNACKAFEKSGIDLLDISGGLMGYSRPEKNAEGWFSEETRAIKKAVSIPVISTGGIHSPQVAENLIKDSSADLIGVGRALLKNPVWAVDAKKILET